MKQYINISKTIEGRMKPLDLRSIKIIKPCPKCNGRKILFNEFGLPVRCVNCSTK